MIKVSCKSCIVFGCRYKNKIAGYHEKRLLTYNPSLAAKKRYEINRMIEKAKLLTASQTKRTEYGEAGKYVCFTDGKGNKASVSMNQAK